MNRFFFTVAIALVTSIATGGTMENARNIIERLDMPRDVPVPFLELRNNKLLSSPLELSGEIIFSSSGELSKIIYAPIQERVTISTVQITLERNGRTRVLPMRRKRGVREFYLGLRALLEGDLATVSELFEIDATNDGAEWTIELKPQAGNLKAFIQEMSVSGEGGRVSRIRTMQSKQDWQELYFYPEGLE